MTQGRPVGSAQEQSRRDAHEPRPGLLGELLDPAQSHLQRIIPGPQLQRLRAVVDMFPLALTSVVGFEFHPGTSATADLLIPVAAPGRYVLARQAETRLSDAFYDLAVWRRLSRLADVWGDPASPLSERLLTLWLEFDCPAAVAGQPPAPFVILSLSDAGRLVPGDELSWCLDQTLPAVLGHELDPTTTDLLKRCVDGLDDTGAGIADVGLAVNRTPVTVRLNVKDLPSTGIAAYAQRIGWPGTDRDRDRLEELIAALTPLVPTIKLCVDASTEIGPKLGLECPISAEQRLTADGWSPLLHLVRRRGLLGDDLAEALLAYVGTSYADAAGPWPVALRTASALLGRRYQSVLVRDLSHVKISVGAGGQESAKVYGYLGYGWRRRAR